MSGIRRLFWDIETSPNVVLSWRVGYKLSISHENIVDERQVICICYKWEGEDEVHRLTWSRGSDKAMLKAFMKVANEADELVAQNGDRFDLKWFNTRCLIHGLEPVPQYKTVDTLKIARRYFNFNSNKLDYLGSILEGRGKQDTDFGMWRDITLKTKNAAASLKRMVDYCADDVVLLERVYNKLAAFATPKTHSGVAAGLARWTCPHCASEEVVLSKKRVTAAGIKQYQMRCHDCKRYYQVSATVFRAYAEDTV